MAAGSEIMPKNGKHQLAKNGIFYQVLENKALMMNSKGDA